MRTTCARPGSASTGSMSPTIPTLVIRRTDHAGHRDNGFPAVTRRCGPKAVRAGSGASPGGRSIIRVTAAGPGAGVAFYLRRSGPMGFLNEARREFIAAPDDAKSQIVYKWPDHNIRK